MYSQFMMHGQKNIKSFTLVCKSCLCSSHQGKQEKSHYSSSLLNLGTRWRWVVNVTPMKGPLYPVNRRLGGPHSRSGPFGEETNLLSLPGFEPGIVQSIA